LHHAWLVAVLCLSAALAFAASSSLKHTSAAKAPDAQSLQPGRVGRFAWATLSHRLWLTGIAFDVVGLALQVVALHLGNLAFVQPLLITSLLFALIMRQRYEHHHITRTQVGWAVVLTAALGGFLLFVATGSGPQTADRLPAVVAGAVGAALAVTCVELGRRQQAQAYSAALLGVAVGVVYAATAALLKGITDIAVRSPLEVLFSWQLYLVVALGLAGLLLNQLAFQAGPLTASLPASATVDPLLSVAVGVVVYDEHISRGPGGGIILVLLVIVLGVAVTQLTRSPDQNITSETP
jgi:drug/metabolite transporter (DMT)-like permease